MKAGWAGLGKLGLPCALVLAQHHQVWGYDPGDRPWKILAGELPPMQEEGIAGLLAGDPEISRCDTPAGLVAACDIIFVAVQTPHAPEWGGDRPMPEEAPRDFEYAFLVQACRDICRAAEAQRKFVTLVVVSTVLPGTTERLIRPLANAWIQLVYSPQFIAMGTAIRDFTDPEFVICGTDDYGDGPAALRAALLPLHGSDRLIVTSIASAEAVKVFYNTFISMKITWANHVMELCHKTGADCDVVTDALSRATDRVISARYLRGGMGDGGACHPRDLVALSWLERQMDASFPLFGILAGGREQQARWLAGLVRSWAELTGLEVAILGKSYKPGSDLTDGSPALLLAHYLDDVNGGGFPPGQYDPHTENTVIAPVGRKVFVIATRHEEFRNWDYEPGSVVIDPFGYIPDSPGVTVIRVGRKK